MEKSEPDLLWRLTAEQRREIYEQEKRRIERTSPTISNQTKILLAIYILGCILMYFGIPQSFIDFCGTRRWTYQPEKDVFLSIFKGAVEIIRPFLAVVICFWVVFIPVGIVWVLGGDLLKYLKRLINYRNE